MGSDDFEGEGGEFGGGGASDSFEVEGDPRPSVVVPVKKRALKAAMEISCGPPIHDMVGLGLWTLVSPLIVDIQYALLRASTPPGDPEAKFLENQKHIKCFGSPKSASVGRSVRDIMQMHPWNLPSILVGAGVGAYHGHQKKDGFKTTAGYAALGATFPFIFLGYFAYNKFYKKGK